METSLLSTKGFSALIEKCPLLEVLHLDVSVFMLPNSIWRMLAAQCPRLRVLSVHHANTASSLPEPEALYEMFPNMEDVHVQPMILDTIFKYLDRDDVLRCVYVSRAWYTHLNPLVWRSINIKIPAQRTLFQSSTVQLALVRNAAHVHHLSITFQSLCSIFLPRYIPPHFIQPRSVSIGGFRRALLTNLRTLEWFNIKDRPSSNVHPTALPYRFTRHDSKLDAQFASLVRQQKSALSTLVIDVPISSKLLLQLVTEDMPHLQHLDVRSAGSELDLKTMLENLPESIRTVSVTKQRIRLPSDNNSNNNSNKKSCSNNLKELGGDVRLGCFRNKSLARALAKLGIFLNRFQYGDLPNGLRSRDCEIAYLLSLSSDWTDLSNLRALNGVGPLTLAAILDQCEHLETIDLGRRAKIVDTDVQLQELVLGWPERDMTHHESKCLDMTLANGLDELAGLKKLAVLDLGDMAHAVGVDELEWMSQHWCGMRRLSGVVRLWKTLPGTRDAFKTDRVQKWIGISRQDWGEDPEVRLEPRTESHIERNSRSIEEMEELVDSLVGSSIVDSDLGRVSAHQKTQRPFN
ncbi:hypothetical protein CPB97_007329 [Podila verticillata]|nr:hypothetical protein CPB97_007329 [Podila verticillata]